MDLKKTNGVGGVQPTRELEDPAARLREDGRAFQAEYRRAFIQRHKPETSRGRVAVGFDGRIIVSGVRAEEALGHLNDLVRLSPTFRGVLEKSLADNDTVWITIGYGGGNSRSTIGARDEKVYINLAQGDLRDLIIHECGHALAKLKDGPLGGFGPNQRFQAVVKREIDEHTGVQAYGTEVRQTNHGPPRGRAG